MTDDKAAPRGLKALFLGHQEVLKAELVQARAGIEHPTLKGDGAEGRWRSVLAKHMPRRYRICRGVVVDSTGTESDALDIIIHDAHFCPLLLDQDGTCFVPAESVYAVFEAKQAMNAGHVQYAGKKAASVRRLHRTSAPIIDRGETRPARAVPPILAGVLALESEWADGLGNHFNQALIKLKADERLDLGCALTAGAFEALEGGDVTIYPAHTALVSFFVRLVSRLQQLGTVPAIEWGSYADRLLQ